MLRFLIQYFALSESGESMELLLQPELSEKLSVLFMEEVVPHFLLSYILSSEALPKQH